MFGCKLAKTTASRAEAPPGCGDKHPTEGSPLAPGQRSSCHVPMVTRISVVAHCCNVPICMKHPHLSFAFDISFFIFYVTKSLFTAVVKMNGTITLLWIGTYRQQSSS